MAESITLPAVGAVKKTWLYVGGAAVAGILGYAYLSRARSGEAVEPDPYPPTDGGLLPPGSSTTPGLSHEPPEPPDPDKLPPVDNGTWFRRAVEYMAGLSYDVQLVSGVLGKYLARQPLTKTEADIVRTVEGAMGRPPVGEYRIILVGDPPPGPNPPGPNPPSSSPPKAPHVHHIITTRDSATVQWHPGAGAVSYVVYMTGGRVAADGVRGTSYTVRGLKPDTSYSFSVAGRNATGARSPLSNVLTVRTKK